MTKPGRIAKAAARDEAVRQAVAVMQNGRPAEAERMLRDLLSTGPRLPPALHALGLTLLQQRRAAEAVAPLAEAARERADPVIETNLAIALHQSGKTPEAISWLERAVAR